MGTLATGSVLIAVSSVFGLVWTGLIAKFYCGWDDCSGCCSFVEVELACVGAAVGDAVEDAKSSPRRGPSM